MIRTIERPKADKITEPAKRWQNRGLVLKPFRSIETGELRKPGEIYCGKNLWPSKDVAESKAEEFSRDIHHAFHTGHAEYLGAFPVEAS